MKTNSITITYLSKVSFASLNGSDKEVDNINPIKKITLDNGEELPYVSSQAIRRALRDKLEELGNKLSPINEASVKKGAPKTSLNPKEFIDDDLFGYMDASKDEGADKGKSTTRTSPIRVESLVALSTYKGDLDFATNFMGKGKKGKDGKEIQPNIFETEIHSGIYRGTILIELDRIGCGEGFQEELSKQEKGKRVKAFLDAFRTLWSSGRQSRFLADISPKFIAAAYMKSKNPIFLESVELDEKGEINIEKLKTVVSDYHKFLEKSVFAVQEAVFKKTDGMVSLNKGFEDIEKWVEDYFKENENQK
ncbi:MAG: type I-B CRISPR-associated protein Cas7/Cst2/DevR [Spirochaetes bacterium GWB1_36_13]|nr:MAG: type I-B CRISPR-associated protein Cas7/Cst2/DevR [Spirochaetes bacterium GWB1_36_13]